MKALQKTGYTFAPATRTLDFGGVAGFDVRGLFAVINLASGDPIYVIGTEGLGYAALNGSALTLVTDTTAMSASDPLLVLYDDGAVPASAPLQSAGNATLTSILAALPALVNGCTPVDGSGVTQPVSAAALPLPAGAATAARQDTAAATLTNILAALQAQIDLETSVWTDGTAFFVRRESVNEGTGAITVSFTNPDGTAASPNAANLRPASSDNAVQLIQALFDVKTAGTGYSVGDQLARVVAVNKATNPPTASGAIWINLTTGEVITAPVAANIAETDQNVVVTSTALGDTADTAATSDTGSFSLVALAKRALGNWTTLLARIPTVGQKTAAASVPVTLASDQSAVSTKSDVPAAVDGSYGPATTPTNALAANPKRAAVLVYNPNTFPVFINFRDPATTSEAEAGNIKIAGSGGEWRSPVGMCPKTAMSIIAGTGGGVVTIMEGTTA